MYVAIFVLLFVVVENAKHLKGKCEDDQHRNEIEKLRKKVDRYRSLIEHTQKLYKVMNIQIDNFKYGAWCQFRL